MDTNGKCLTSYWHTGYQDELINALKDPAEAAAYLNAHLEEEKGDTHDLFLLSLRNIAKAQGFAHVTRSAGVGRESMYKSLSSKGNPRLKTLQALLHAVGLRLAVQVDSKLLVFLIEYTIAK